MAYFNILLNSLWGNKVRLLYTSGSIVVAFVLFGLLLPLDRVFSSRVIFADADRLVVTNKTSIMRPLPVAYQSEIEEISGTLLVGHFTLFGAFYQTPEQGIAALATDPERFNEMVDEVEFVDKQAYQNWLNNPTGVAVGRQLAERFNWSQGDIIPLFSNFYQRNDGSRVWTFTISAIYDGVGKDANTNSLIINYEYFDRARNSRQGTVGWYAVRIADAKEAEQYATRLDEHFKNRPAPTKTTTEKMFAQSFLQQVGNFGQMISIALILVFWTVILVTANAMAQSVRQQYYSYGVLKAIGFSNAAVFKLVVLEGACLVLASGGVGLGLAFMIIHVVSGSTNQMLSYMSMNAMDVTWGALLMLVIAIITSVLPASSASRCAIGQAMKE
uniref:ABC3 transporter permease C-terminal domain-containing protein n=2 Tax=Pseudoalteromonas rubra TaxID=43658 RepID=A0A0F4QXX6_9GAMM|nr:hypothetical protein TW77_06030 [Pseudoalteromonas rubra]